jgi:hypothetical protein
LGFWLSSGFMRRSSKLSHLPLEQGCQMVCFQAKNTNLGKHFRASDWYINVDGHLEYFIDIWNIWWPFGTFCVHLVHFFQLWYHAPRKIWQPCFGAAKNVGSVPTPSQVAVGVLKCQFAICPGDFSRLSKFGGALQPISKSQLYTFYGAVQRAILTFAHGPQGWTLSPRGDVHPRAWTLSTV